jgi:outer membrane protein
MRHGRTNHGRSLLAVLALACAVILPAGPAAAQPVTVGYVDIEKVINDSTPGQKAIEKLRKDFERRAADLKKMEEGLKKLRDELDSKGSVMSDERRRRLEENYRRDRRDLKRAIRDNNEEFNIKRKQVLVDFLPKVLKTVKDIGKENKYTLILRKEANILLYTAEQVDLTEEVITRLNAQASGQ